MPLHQQSQWLDRHPMPLHQQSQRLALIPMPLHQQSQWLAQIGLNRKPIGQLNALKTVDFLVKLL